MICARSLQLNAAAVETLTDPEARCKLMERGYDVLPSTLEAFSARLRGEIKRWAA